MTAQQKNLGFDGILLRCARRFVLAVILFSPAVMASALGFAGGEFSLTERAVADRQTWEAATAVDLNLSNVNAIVDSQGRVHVFGLVTNQLSAWVFNASVVVALRDEQGRILQLRGQRFGTLSSGESHPFAFRFDSLVPFSWTENYTARATAFLWPPDFPTPLPGFPNPPGPPIGGPPPPGPPPPVPTFPATATLVPGTNPTPFPTFTPSAYPYVREALASVADCLNLALAYDASDALDPWKLYDNMAVVFANDLLYMIPGRGYWILVNCDSTLSYKGRSVRLKEGWNLIGWPP